MAEVTGPISTLPGAGHDLPEGTPCDEHPDRPAVARIQGETDSMGCEMIDMCQECLDEHRAYVRSPEASAGRCDWCKKDATDLRHTRDYEEGMNGPVYEVCGACRKRVNDEAEAYLDSLDDGRWDEPDDFDPREDCSRWDQRTQRFDTVCGLADEGPCHHCPYAVSSTPEAPPTSIDGETL